MIVAALPPEAPRPAARDALTAGPIVSVAPHRGQAVTAAGLALGASRAFAHASLGLALDVPVLPAGLTIGGTAVRLTRVPLRLVVGRAATRGPVSVAVEAGAVAAVLRVERTAPAPTTGATRVEAGAHIGLQAVFSASRIGFYVAVSSDWIPMTYPITLDPEGEVDRTPAFWLAGEAGLRFAFH